MLKASGPGRINEIVVKKELDAAQGMVPSSAVVTTSGGSYATGYGAAEFTADLRGHHSPFLQHPQHLTLKEGSSRISSNQQDFLPPYGPFVEQNPSRGTFVSLATQDFLQPLERGGREENGIAAGLEIARHVGNGIVNGSVDNSSPKSLLQLSVRNGSLRDKLYNEREDHQRKDAGSDQLKEKGQSCTSWSTLRMQSGYSELPHANRGTISGLEASQPSVMGINRHWQQNPATNAGKRSRSVPSEDDEIDDDCDRRKVHKGEGIQRDDAISKSVENKGNTPRSKHSATEQRRRSKINDRFQMLRDLVPHGDQKRDKASFLLEVVEYIQALQEKVKKCEAVEQGRHQEKLKSIAWDLSKRNIAHTSPDDIAVLDRDINSFPSTSPHKANNSGIVEAELTSVGAHVSTSNNHNPGRSGLSSQQPRISLSPSMPETRAAEDLPKAEALISERVLQSAQTDIIKQADAGKTVSSTGILEQTAACDGKNISSSEKESRRCEQEDVPITGGVISVSTAYSQGLLDALTRALHSSGLDLSQANISVQIELGKASTNGTSSKVPS